MTPKEFEDQYLCAWKPDPILEECVAFLRYATPAMVREYKREGLFSGQCIRDARRIIESEHD